MKRINRWYVFSMKTELSYLAFLNSLPSIPFYFVLIARLRRAIVPRQGKAFELLSKGIELLDTHLAMFR
ncbi:hypothetical protein [Bacteroides fragilis]|uniref:hypothetical protein n=1 Tax=Bacteroides fragilis TaxID=817 RepID=UPI0011B5FEBD|nr:hypothetical protein [Bacteroides fragilis]KAB5421700.1 hypothetical protein F9000_07630 [Bacteroides fragilis]KAB5430802.1 hypothetical protein F9Z99_08920 [Bacteroides fragilis]NME76610.1 hypothetical protein [Bacteroides fragilis]TWV10039.1 hypothetical protein FSA69_07630 [Bacteroides fragilis]